MSDNENEVDEIPIEQRLIDACKRGNVAFVKDYCDKGLNVNKADVTKSTPLHWACRGGHKEIVDLLLNDRIPPKLNVVVSICFQNNIINID